MHGFVGLFSPASLTLAGEILLKIFVGLVVAAGIGWERELHGRPAGMRTHMLMVMGVILFAEASKYFGGGTPDRIAAQILTGVGFLGAGTIMRMGPEVRGLTSAASIWATAAIGVAISVGGAFIVVAVVSTFIALVVLAYLDNFERRVKDSMRTRAMRVSVVGQKVILSIFQALADTHMHVQSIKMLEAEAGLQLEMELTGDPVVALQTVAGVEGVTAARWTA
jgi:putative Mg2+ transporter-C (MgtC) family protein